MEATLAIHQDTAEPPTEVSSRVASTEAPSDDAGEQTIITDYLLERSAQYRELSELRKEGWNNPAGDEFFAKQRALADSTHNDNGPEAESMARNLYRMMQNNGVALQNATGAFTVPKPQGGAPKILDMCMAPGGFLSTALKYNPGATATAYSLPFEAGGHRVFLEHADVEVEMLDITLLAADMGTDQIPEDHPDKNKFLPAHFQSGRAFDIVLCDGQVLRTHPRAEYRARSEAFRLTATQLALGLEHLNPGGTMVVLLHRVEVPSVVKLLFKFHQFSTIQLFKPAKAHAKRSSFYLVASNIQVDHPEAIKAVEEWKRSWKIATFGNEEEWKEHNRKDTALEEAILQEFGSVLISKGNPIWEIQARALEKAPFIAKQPQRPQMSSSWRRA